MAEQPKQSNAFTSFEPVQETRFAVVMYGGVSLAIYINGVAQELLQLVKSSAPTAPLGSNPTVAVPDTQLTGSARVYRRLAKYLGSDQDLSEIKDGDANPIRTRFVIDILSGSSAGGINGIFLAKALANDQPMDGIKRLWIEEGDIARLVNDAESASDLPGLSVKDPPASLLNSERLYAKLLQALERMENDPGDAPARRPSPYVDELDLFVTATDVRGLTLPISLADRVVYERRHRNVFHFLYATAAATGDDRNDFQRDNNPFLAFAARCTSAFPFAFEPMRLCDVDAVLKTTARYKARPRAPDDQANVYSNGDRWRTFFKDYLGDPTVPYAERAFSDGGCLDNKPFSYATEMLLRRGASYPVDRKLIYIEPSPDCPERQPARAGKPDALENVKAAVLDLPLYETIREDIQRVLDRNRLIGRLKGALRGVERAAAILYDSDSEHRKPLSGEEFAKLDLAEMVRRKGVSYGAYHRLRVSALTDELTGLLVRIAGFSEDSDDFLAVRYLMRAWRDSRYIEERNEGSSKPTRNRLLLDFDLSYRLRRLYFVQRHLDEIFLLDAQARETMQQGCVAEEMLPRADEERRLFRDELLKIKGELSRVAMLLRRGGRQLRQRGQADDLSKLVGDLGITRQDLLVILDERKEQKRREKAERLLKEGDRDSKLDAVAAAVARQFRQTVGEIAGACQQALDPQRLLDQGCRPRLAARQCLWHYYRHYDDYDLILFPFLYGTALGEADEVDIIRISPVDAPSLIDENDSNERRRKLAGTAMFHFGAFLDALWRRNDMLWGRLDGAERIITALLPKDDLGRDALVEQAQCAILGEELRPQDRASLCRLLGDVLMQLEPADRNSKGLRSLEAISQMPQQDQNAG